MVSPRFTQGGVSERWGETLPEGGKDGYDKRGEEGRGIIREERGREEADGTGFMTEVNNDDNYGENHIPKKFVWSECKRGEEKREDRRGEG